MFESSKSLMSSLPLKSSLSYAYELQKLQTFIIKIFLIDEYMYDFSAKKLPSHHRQHRHHNLTPKINLLHNRDAISARHIIYVKSFKFNIFQIRWDRHYSYKIVILDNWIYTYRKTGSLYRC